MDVETSNRTPVITDGDVLVHPDEEITYRSVSVLSIVALAAGLLAPMCLVGPLLWVIPIVGAAISLAAVVRIGGSEGTLIGRRAAMVGLALCVASIAAAASRSAVARYLAARQAREAALEWIETLQAGNSEQAFRNTSTGARQPSTPPADTRNETDEHQQEAGEADEHDQEASPLEQFRDQPVVQFLSTDGAEMTARYDGTLDVEFGARGEVYVQLQFAYGPAVDSAAAAKTTLQIALVRSRSSSLVPSRWLVSTFESDDLPPSAAGAVP